MKQSSMALAFFCALAGLAGVSPARAADANVYFLPGTGTQLYSAGADFQVKVYLTTNTGKSVSDFEVNVRLDNATNGIKFENPLTAVVKGGDAFNCSTPSVTQVSDEDVSVTISCSPAISGVGKHLLTLKYAYPNVRPCTSYTEEMYGYCTADNGTDTCSVGSSFLTICNNLSCTQC